MKSVDSRIGGVDERDRERESERELQSGGEERCGLQEQNG